MKDTLSYLLEAKGKDPLETWAKEKARQEERKAKEERAKKDYEQKAETIKNKRERLAWQQERSKINDDIRKKRALRKYHSPTSSITMDTISGKHGGDKDPTATQKAMHGVASYAKAAIGLGAKAVIRAAKNRKKKKEEPKGKADTTPPSLPPSKPKGLPPSGGGNSGGGGSGGSSSKSKRLSSSSSSPTPSVSVGQQARKDPEFKKKQIKMRGGNVNEEFSCWREEILYEIAELRQKSKKGKEPKDKIIDVMKGTNKITIGPNLKENYLEERKRDQLANAVLATSFALGAAQSPKDLVRSGHIEGPGIQLMGRMMRRAKEANRNLDSGRVSHPARNIKKKTKIEESKYSKSNLSCNSPKSDPVGDNKTGKSHVVKACSGTEERLIRFGQRGVKGSPKKAGESKKYAKRRHSFKARHASNIARGKMSAAYWSSKVKW